MLEIGTALRAAGQRLVRTVDGLPDAEVRAPSLLPGWSRAHVIAHLALNAEALAGAVEGVLAGEPVPMYASVTARDEEIEELAGLADTDVQALRERVLGSTTQVTEAFVQLAQAVQERPEVDDAIVERTPGGRTFVLGGVGTMRLRELEIHHVDLGLDYAVADWEADFAVLVIETLAAAPVVPTQAVLVPTDDERRWSVGTGGPVVSGPLRDLAWWLTGRPAGPEVSSESGTLPQVEAW